jgi:exopolyphosphatase / guanosine-5'-triphosphate,3'-diphosphate pyrophosphatase
MNHRVIRSLLLVLVPVLGSALLWAAEPPYRTLAAFDIGSGSTRMLVADVALCSGDILTIHEQSMVRVSYAEDLLRGGQGRFSPALLQEANAVMSGLVEQARFYNPDQLIAVATQAFRMAANAETLLQQWQAEFGIEARIISQQDEARLAYELVANRLGRPMPRLLVWDIGAGSQQLVWKDPANGSWHHLNSDIASVSFRDRALDWLDRPADRLSPNPIDPDEAEQLAMALSNWIDEAQTIALRDFVDHGVHVVGIGGVHGASLAKQLSLEPGETIITREAIQAALTRQLGRSDEEIGGGYADTEVVNLILVGTLMDHIGIQQYQVMPMNLTEALLLAHARFCDQAHSSLAAP